jgi:hypothetical protein
VPRLRVLANGWFLEVQRIAQQKSFAIGMERITVPAGTFDTYESKRVASTWS